MSIKQLIEMSNRYGANEEYVLAGGGNTSFKKSGVMYVKGSGTQLSDIIEEQFVAMDVEALQSMLGKDFFAGVSDEQRESKALEAIMNARKSGEENKRPSVEAILHALFPHEFVLHVHPPLVNGLTCGKNGEAICKEMFGDSIVWIELTKPGFLLAERCNDAFIKAKSATGTFPQIVFLENHGVFFAADTVSEIDKIVDDVFSKLKSRITEFPDVTKPKFDKESVCNIAPMLRMLYSEDGKAIARFFVNNSLLAFLADNNSFKSISKSFTPDHIVYTKDEPLFVEKAENIPDAFAKFTERKGYKPKIVAVAGLGCFALGKNNKEVEGAEYLFLDAVKIAVYAKSFGGEAPLPQEFIDFISNWEAESYRSKVSFGTNNTGTLDGKIVVVTGGAQGFGKGISESMASKGAYIVVADLNYDGAKECASMLCSKYGTNSAIPVKVDVSNEYDVKNMIEETVLTYGGLDVLISNAGILIAGSLTDLSKEDFDLVTSVNYTGYFLCAKYGSVPMKIQREHAPDYVADIIEINSKSGLEGSNKNFAYAGSKFGGIGLTQSFALELAPFGIKVNAICPGNYLDGPLWSDPERGLFRQYLDAKKVSGAKTIDDVRKAYEARVPLGRGCEVDDVARAIEYVISQKYETGQALPVTGGQVMMR